MQCTYNQLISGIQKYAEKNIVSKITDARKWVVGGYIALAINKLSAHPESILSNPMISYIGVVDQNGMIDIDSVRDALMAQAKNGSTHIMIPYIGEYKIDASDIDMLYNDIVSS